MVGRRPNARSVEGVGSASMVGRSADARSVGGVGSASMVGRRLNARSVGKRKDLTTQRATCLHRCLVNARICSTMCAGELESNTLSRYSLSLLMYVVANAAYLHVVLECFHGDRVAVFGLSCTSLHVCMMN